MAESLSQDSWVSNKLGLREQGVRTLVQTALSRGSPHYSAGQGLGGTSPLSSLGRVSSWGYRSQTWEMCTLKVGETASAGARPCYVGSHGLPFPLLSWGGTCLRRSFARIRDASVSCNQIPEEVPEEGRADRTHVRFCQQGPLVRPAQAHHQKPRAEQVGR